MLIYDYKCQDCGKIAEIFLKKMDGGQPVVCPVCGSKNVEKLVSASYVLQIEAKAPGRTCCGKAERCETPPCSLNDTCRRDSK